jgi:hypothetical protein
MRVMPNTITPRTPLTLTELETLAVMLDTGSQHMTNVKDDNGDYAWPSGDVTGVSSTMSDMFAGFFEIRDNTAILTAGPDGWPYDIPEAHVTITDAA